MSQQSFSTKDADRWLRDITVKYAGEVNDVRVVLVTDEDTAPKWYVSKYDTREDMLNILRGQFSKLVNDIGFVTAYARDIYVVLLVGPDVMDIVSKATALPADAALSSFFESPNEYQRKALLRGLRYRHPKMPLSHNRGVNLEEMIHHGVDEIDDAIRKAEMNDTGTLHDIIETEVSPEVVHELLRHGYRKRGTEFTGGSRRGGAPLGLGLWHHYFERARSAKRD